MTRRPPRSSASMSPASAASSRSTERFARMWRNSTTSAPATKVPDSSTKASASCSSLGIATRFWRQGPIVAPWATNWNASSVRMGVAAHDIGGDVVERALLGVGVGPKPGQGIHHGDSELDGEDSGGLVHRGSVPAAVEPWVKRTERHLGLQVQDAVYGHIRQYQGIGQLLMVQRARPVAAEVEGAQTNQPDV